MNEQQFVALKARIINLLSLHLSPYLYYHSISHTLRVLEKSIEIAEFEGVEQHKLMLIKIAALFHDTGFITTLKDHEEESCRIAANYLSSYELPASELQLIHGMIMATKIPQQVHNKYEAILADADLEYLGTNDFLKISGLFYQELLHQNPKLTMVEYDKIQIRFFEQHQYFTSFAKKYLSKQKELNLKIVRERYHMAVSEPKR